MFSRDDPPLWLIYSKGKLISKLTIYAIFNLNYCFILTLVCLASTSYFSVENFFAVQGAQIASRNMQLAPTIYEFLDNCLENI